MKKLLVFSALFIALASQAQQKMKLHIDGKDSIFYFPVDSFFANYKAGNVATIYKMPNALQGVTDNQQLIGNNGNGFNTYKSQVDGMAVIKPDVNNAATLKAWNAYVAALASNDNVSVTWIPGHTIKPFKAPQQSLMKPLLRNKK